MSEGSGVTTLLLRKAVAFFFLLVMWSAEVHNFRTPMRLRMPYASGLSYEPFGLLVIILRCIVILCGKTNHLLNLS